MIIKANDMGDQQVYVNTEQVIQIIEIDDDTYNVILVGDKSAQINGETLRKIEREA
ncbi:MAG TPA: hypothetical protein VIH90_04155 [Candidatus Saccharimonadales bacterium]